MKWLIGCVGLLVVAGLVFGTTTLRAVGGRVKQGIEDAKPNEQVAAEVDVALADLGKDIDTYADKLVDLEQRRDSSQHRTEQIAADVDKQNQILVRAKQLLDSGKNELVIGDRKYTKQQVSSDAVERLARCEQLQEDLKAAREALDQLNKAVAEGRRNLQEVQSLYRKKSYDLTHLKDRLDNARLRTQINELAEQVAVSPLKRDTALAALFDRLESRVRTAERHASSTEANKMGNVVTWEGDEGAISASDAIARHIQQAGKETAKAK